MQRMTIPLCELKLAPPESKTMHFSGYGAVFGNVDAYGDVIQKGAFARTIHEAKSSGRWPAMLSQHGAWGMTAQDLTPVGVWSDLSEDDVGLKVEGDLAPTSRGQELHTLMKMKPRPAIDGLSIGFIPIKWRSRSKPEEPRRTLEEIKLMEISPVTFPANGLARVSDVKSAGGWTEREFERWLMQDAGLTRSEARVVLTSGFKALQAMQDAGGEVLDEVTALLRRNLTAITKE
ncbi:MAG: HK97 family phage prohead protease [Phycisphaerales bacterium]|nr:HK97 family phage prohead protease [Phycisphaerales bacterium]